MDQIDTFVWRADQKSVTDVLARLDQLWVMSSSASSSAECELSEADVRKLEGCPPPRVPLDGAQWTHTQVTSTRSAMATVRGFQCKKRNLLSRLFLHSDRPYEVKMVTYHDARVRDVRASSDQLFEETCTLLLSSSATFDKQVSAMRERILAKCPFVRFDDTLSYDSIAKLSGQEAHMQMSYGKRPVTVYRAKMHKTRGMVAMTQPDGTERLIHTAQQAQDDSVGSSVAFDILTQWQSSNQLIVEGVLHC
jgi:hypothetical protein